MSGGVYIIVWESGLRRPLCWEVDRVSGAVGSCEGVGGAVGGLPFVAANRVGLSSHRQGPPQHCTDEAMFTVGVKGDGVEAGWVCPPADLTNQG